MNTSESFYRPWYFDISQRQQIVMLRDYFYQSIPRLNYFYYFRCGNTYKKRYQLNNILAKLFIGLDISIFLNSGKRLCRVIICTDSQAKLFLLVPSR